MPLSRAKGLPRVACALFAIGIVLPAAMFFFAFRRMLKGDVLPMHDAASIGLVLEAIAAGLGLYGFRSAYGKVALFGAVPAAFLLILLLGSLH